MRTQVAIIGGGPSGLLLSQLLHIAGVDSIILERRTKEHVLSRIRAGVLEQGFVSLLEQAGCAERLHAEGFVHDGVNISDDGEMFHIPFRALTGKPMVVYGQTEVTRDLYAAREAAGARIFYEVENVTIHGAESDSPSVTFEQAGTRHEIGCDFVAGCDGFHGVSRESIPAHRRTVREKVYPFGWLGVLSRTPPVHDELIYAGSARGFALCSMRNTNLSRYYIQVPLTDRVEDWPDEAFWEELRRRIPAEQAERLVTGPSIEKSIAPLRSFVSEPMRWGRLFLCGDAAHIVPPTGAKGLNTAASDVHYLFEALRDFYTLGSEDGLRAYSDRALLRVWKTQRFSWWLTMLLHRFPEQSDFERKMQAAELALLRDNDTAQRLLAEQYVGLPY